MEPTESKHWTGDDDRDEGCSDNAETCECPECREWRDNREPGDADGEAFRGGEAAADARDAMADALKVKRG